MASPCVYDILRNAVMEDDVKAVAEILRGCADVDLARHIGDEGNLLSIAIESAAVETLALIVGVEFPPRRGDVTVSYDMHSLINSPCDQSSLTPLMKAAKLGKRDMLHLLLCVGAEVNRVSRGGKAAIDYSVDPEIVHTLLEHDSVLPSLDTDSKLHDFNDLISTNDKLEEIFRARDNIHESIGKGVFDSEMMGEFGSGRWVYYVNSKGHSALYTAAMSKNFDALVYFEEQGMLCVSAKEREGVDTQKSFHEEMLDRSVRRLLHDIEGSHVMKMFCVSKVFGRSMKGVDARSRVLSYFQHLDEDDSTKVLMQVVQHVPGLIIAFDFNSTGVNRMRASCSRLIHGLTDFDRARIYIGAMETDDFGFQEIVSNLAHELCHMAMWAVYDNGGLPFPKDDEGRGCNYRKMQDTVLDIIKSRKVDRILSRVLKYPEGLHGQELIVRCPEMVSKYLKSDAVGEDRLKSEVPDLLNYYEQCVMPDLLDYMDRNFTTNGISERGLMSYQKLLTESQMDGIGVVEDIGIDVKTSIGKHNYLQVLKASNVKLARSHLCMMFKMDGKASPLFVDWSLYLKCRDLFLKGLKSGEIGNLVIAWDVSTAPKFCKLSSCRTASCPGYDFRDYEDCVMLLVGSQWQVPIGIEALSYCWDDLCEETKEFILERRVNMVGKPVMLRKVISPDKESVQIDNFMRDCLDSVDLCLLLEEENIVVGNINSLPGGREGNVILKHPGCFISRTLSQKFVNFDENVFEKFRNDMFLLSNVDYLHLCSLGIPEKYIGYWNGSILNGRVRCYILDPKSEGNVDEESLYQEVFDVFSSGGYAEMLHYLKFRQGMFVLVKSDCCTWNIESHRAKVNDLLSFNTFENLLETSAFKSNEALLIADDPGTGKTIYLHQLSKEIKDRNPGKWVSVIDLSLQEQQKLFVDWSRSLSPDNTVADFLFQMVKSGSSALERKVFEVYCRRVNDVVVMFDGFDEICPTYKDVVTSFLLSIRKVNVNIKVFVSTRHHERGDLEKALCAVSYQLTPFSVEEQVTFMSEYWNVLLKSLPLRETEAKLQSFVDAVGRWDGDGSDEFIPEFMKELTEALLCSQGKSKRKKLKVNFKLVAKRVMLGQETFFSDLDGFMETPLHIQMVAALTFEDSLNLSMTENLGHLYLRFFELKIRIYWREKIYTSGNVQAEKQLRIHAITISSVLEKMSVYVLLDWKSFELGKEDIAEVLSTGLMGMRGHSYQFNHRTFAEFFLALQLLREGCKYEMAHLWLNHVLMDDSFVRVRDFLEDILSLLSMHVAVSEIPGGHLLSKKVEKISSEILSMRGIEALTIPIYALIVHGCANVLQHFADSFGDKVGKVLLMNLKPFEWYLPGSATMMRALHDYHLLAWMFLELGNAFTLASHTITRGRERKMPTSKYLKLLQKMLELLEKYNLLNEMRDSIQSSGILWLFPNYHEDNTGSLIYNAEVVSFLVRNKELFSDVLRREELFFVGERSKSVCVLNFDLMKLVMGATRSEAERRTAFKEKGALFACWLHAFEEGSLRSVEQIWDYIVENLVEKEDARKYLEWKNELGVTVLVISACHDDPGVIRFIWKIAGELMSSQETKRWLFDCFGSVVRFPMQKYLKWGFHMLLLHLLDGGDISGDGLLRILMSKDKATMETPLYILRCYPYILFNDALPIDHHLPEEGRAELMETLTGLTHNLSYQYFMSPNSMSECLRDTVETVFEGVRSRDRYKLADPLIVGRNGLLKDFEIIFEDRVHGDRFKCFIAIIYKQFELYRKRLGREGLLERVRRPEQFLVNMGPNVLHRVTTYMNPCSLGYVCSILLEFATPEDVLGLLLDQNDQGHTLLHTSAQRIHIRFWDKVYNIARALCGEDALSWVHSQPNKKGLYIQDIFLGKDEEEEEIICPC